MSTGRPAKCTGMSALVRGVMAASAWARSMLRVARSTSTNTGLAPTRRMTLGVAVKLMAGVMTSSPGPMPHTCKATSSPPVAEVRERTGRPPRYSERPFSKACTLGPLASQPERRTSTTPWMVSSSRVGRVKGR